MGYSLEYSPRSAACIRERRGDSHRKLQYRMPGYEASAVCERVGLVCPHCKLILRDAVQTDEGVRLCQSCFKEITWYVLQCMRSLYMYPSK